MNRAHIRILLIIISFALPQSVSAQFFDDVFQSLQPAPRRPRVQRTVPAPKPVVPQQPAIELADPPYQSRYDRLSEILGALHYLGPLCRPEEKNTWREHMFALIEAENPTQARRDRMIGAFNRTYNGFRENYRNCNASAKLAGERYREEGIRLSRDLTSRFTD